MNHLKRKKEGKEEERSKREKTVKNYKKTWLKKKKRFMTLEWNHLTTSKLQEINLAT